MKYYPELGILTAAFEIICGILVLRFEGRKNILRPLSLTLFLLAIYQVFEVALCWGDKEPNLLLSRLAFLDITWLPPVSILLIANIYPAKTRALFNYAYASLAMAAVMSFWIVMDYRFITGTICQFMYAKYTYASPFFHIYGAFYEITQMSIIFLPAVLIAKAEKEHVRLHLSDMLIGALLFILPAIYISAVVTDVGSNALPSLMCHFALFYAIFLTRLALREKMMAKNPAKYGITESREEDEDDETERNDPWPSGATS